MVSITIQAKDKPNEVVTIRRVLPDDAFRMAALISEDFNKSGATELTIDVSVEGVAPG